MSRARAFTAIIAIIALLTAPTTATASGLSDAIGIDVNFGRGTVRIGTPDPIGAAERLPQMIEGTIRDATTGFTSVALAEAIRYSRDRARRSSRPLPPEVIYDLSRFYPERLLRKVRWSTDWGAVQNGTLQQMILSNGYAAAIALDNVIVFRNGRDLNDRWLWAHELRHSLQFSDLGVDEFARRYIWDSRGLESDADQYANYVMSFPIAGPASQQVRW